MCYKCRGSLIQKRNYIDVSGWKEGRELHGYYKYSTVNCPTLTLWAINRDNLDNL
jgi:hypothetical protein